MDGRSSFGSSDLLSDAAVLGREESKEVPPSLCCRRESMLGATVRPCVAGLLWNDDGPPFALLNRWSWTCGGCWCNGSEGLALAARGLVTCKCVGNGGASSPTSVVAEEPGPLEGDLRRPLPAAACAASPSICEVPVILLGDRNSSRTGICCEVC